MQIQKDEWSQCHRYLAESHSQHCQAPPTSLFTLLQKLREWKWLAKHYYYQSVASIYQVIPDLSCSSLEASRCPPGTLN